MVDYADQHNLSPLNTARAWSHVAELTAAARFQKLNSYVTFTTEDIRQIADYAERHNLRPLDNPVAWRTEVGRRYDFRPVGGRNELPGGAL
jgi:hypothetical protein